MLRGEGSGQDAYQSFDAAAERIEKRLRRYKRRLKDHKGAPRGETIAAAAYVIAAPTTRRPRPPSTTSRS